MLDRTSRSIRLVAFFEAFKGVLVLVVATGLLLLVHKDSHAIAARLVTHMHLNPASNYPNILLDVTNNLQDSRLVFLALGAVAYSALRFVEAYGLFLERTWAEILAAFSGAIYVPVEIVELFREITPLRVAVLVCNVIVVGVVVNALLKRRRARTA